MSHQEHQRGRCHARAYAAPRRPSKRRSQPTIWFQLANVWSTNLSNMSSSLELARKGDRDEFHSLLERCRRQQP